jgi:hypothetical protein
MATSNSPTRGHPKFPQATHSDNDPSAWMAKRAAALLRLYFLPSDSSITHGNKPHNTREVGSTRIDGKDKFLLVKVADKVWIRKEILIWEEVYGKVPKGCVVRVKDTRQNKYDINNLMLISRAHNMKLNTMHRYPEELKKTMRALQKLKRTIKKNGKKQN